MPRTIYSDNSILTKDKEFTFLSDDVVAGAQVINVVSTLGFHSLTTSSGQILCVGELGQEKTEIIRTDNISTSSGTQISGVGASLRTVLRFSHPQDTKVYIIDWDRFEVQHSATVTGTKSTLTTTGADFPEVLQPDQLESIYRDTSQTAGFFFVRFNESIGNTNSDFSDPIPFAGYIDGSVHEIKKRALERVNEKIDGKIISDEFLNRCLWEARREYHQSPGKRPFRRKFNIDIGDALTGSYRIALPEDVEKPHTAENVYGVRIGTERNMRYIDKKEWDFHFRGKPHSTLELPYTFDVSTSIWLLNGRDFSASAVISVEGAVIGLSRITGEQNSFKIITHGNYSTSAGSDVWENISLGLPDRFTVWAQVGGSAYIYFNRPIETTYVNQNIFLDYYRKVVEFQTDFDELDEPYFDIYVPYLAAKIKKRKNPDMDLSKDSDYLEWLARKRIALEGEYDGSFIRLTPDIQHLITFPRHVGPTGNNG